MRASYSYATARGLSRDHYLSTSARVARLEGRAGLARSTLFGRTSSIVRVAVGLHYARCFIALSREDTPGELVPSYQFTLTTLIPRRS